MSVECSTSIDTLPQETLLHIFGFLPAVGLGRTTCVCNTWKVLASDATLWSSLDEGPLRIILKKVFPSIKINVIDGAVWGTCVDLKAWGLTVDNAPSIHHRTLIPILKKILPQVDGDAGVTVLTMPEGLTLNILERLARSPKKGNATRFRAIWKSVSKQFGNNAVTETCAVVLTNSILKTSSGLPVSSQQHLISQLGWEMPGLLPIAALTILTSMSSLESPPTRLYGLDRCETHGRLYERRTYTRCAEKIKDRHVAAGGNFPEGRNIPQGLDIRLSEALDHDHGVGAQWTIKPKDIAIT